MYKKEENFLKFQQLKIVSFVLISLLFASSALFVLQAYSGDFKLKKVNSHYEPEMSEGIILPGTNIKAGMFRYVIDEVKGDETWKAGLLIKDKIYYVESEKYAHMQPKNWVEYTGTFDVGGDSNFGLYKNYLVMDSCAYAASGCNRRMFLFKVSKNSVRLLDVIVKADGDKFSINFISDSDRQKGCITNCPVGNIYIKDIDQDGNPEFKITVYPSFLTVPEYELSIYELYLEIANDRLQIDFNPELYKPLFERENLKKTKRKSDAYYIYGFLAKELDLKKIKAMLKGSGKEPSEQYERVVGLLEGHKKWDSAFHDHGDEKFVLKQYNLQRR
jgi:hypothetical protein